MGDKFTWQILVADDLSFIQIQSAVSGKLLSARENTEKFGDFWMNRVELSPATCETDSCKWRLVSSSTDGFLPLHCNKGTEYVYDY